MMTFNNMRRREAMDEEWEEVGKGIWISFLG